MLLDNLKELIRESNKNDCFDYTPSSIGNILDYAGSWQQDWTTVFKQILRRVKNGKQYYQDNAKSNGKYVTLPVNHEKNMVVFFQSQSNERYQIYEFKILAIKK
jgi:hypothetical protein